MMRDWPITCATVSATQEQRWNEQQLSDLVETPQLRFWCYDKPALVLGCSQRSELAKLPDTLTPVLIRQAGGGAVLVGSWMLSLSVVLPPSHPAVSQGILSCYRWLGLSLSSALQSHFGVPAKALASHGSNSTHWACFASVSPWEVVVDRRKIVGLAQVRRRNGTLLTAGILINTPDWELLCHAMGRPSAFVSQLQCATTSVSEQLGYSVSPHDIYPALAQAVQNNLASFSALEAA